jgi:hypothetical protein
MAIFEEEKMIAKFLKGGFAACLAVPACCLLVTSFGVIFLGMVLEEAAGALWDKATQLSEG